MKIEITCNGCGKIEETNYHCDTCGDNLITKYFGIPITISFSYGHSLDGEEYHFCSNEHAIQFLVNEDKKDKEKK